MSTSSVPADQLEEAWHQATAAPDWDQVFGFSGNAEGWSQFDLATRLELSEIDLEWRWRVSSSEINRYNWQHYQHWLRLDDPACVQLAKRELMTRTCWGDRPAFSQIAQGFSEPQIIIKELGVLFSERFPIHAEISMAGQRVLRTRLPYQSVWGRQTSKEPMSPTIVHHDEAVARVIFAGRDEKRISRRQFTITRQSLSLVSISAEDASVTAHCNGVELSPGDSIQSLLPITLSNQHWSLRLEAE